MKILSKIAFSKNEPPSTNCLWIKPIGGGVALYIFNNKWEPLRLMNDHGTPSPDDDTPIDPQGGGQIGPNTVGTNEIMDNSIMMEDLNESVREKLQNFYNEDDEAMHMDYDTQEP